MPVLDFFARSLILIGWIYIIFVAAPEFVKDVKEMFREIKRPAARTADHETTNNYNISNFKNISNLEDIK